MRVANQYLKESTLFLQQKTSRMKLNIPLTIVVYFLLWLIGLGLGRLLAQAVFNVFGLIADVNGTIMLALRKLMVCGTQITIFFLWVKFVEKRPVNSIGFQAISPFKLYITGFMIGLCTITTVTLT